MREERVSDRINGSNEDLKLSSCRGYKNYSEGALPFRGKVCRMLVWRREKDLILVLAEDGQDLVHVWGMEWSVKFHRRERR